MYCTTAAKPPLSGFCSPEPKQTIYDYVVTAQMGRIELVADFGVVGKTAFFQALYVCKAFFRKCAFYIEQIDFYRIVLKKKNPGYGQCISAIVPGTGKYDKTV